MSLSVKFSSYLTIKNVVTLRITQGHWKWRQSIEHIRVLIRILLCGHISYRFGDKVIYRSKLAIFFIPTFYIPTPWENGCDYFRADFFQNRARCMAYHMVFIDLAKSPMFTHSSSALQTDRQTDRQTVGKMILIAQRLLRNANKATHFTEVCTHTIRVIKLWLKQYTLT